MIQARLNSGALLHANRCLTSNLNIVLDHFIGLNDLRRHVFGSVIKRHPICRIQNNETVYSMIVLIYNGYLLAT